MQQSYHAVFINTESVSFMPLQQAQKGATVLLRGIYKYQERISPGDMGY